MKGIVILEPNQALITEAISRGLPVTLATRPSIAYVKTLVLGHGTAPPWNELEATWGFLDEWEAAAPLWRYGVNAGDVGTEEERRRTEAVTLDLRVPLYAPEMLFLRRSEGAERLLAEWMRESEGSEPRLAFLRALCHVKPLFLALPRSWLGGD